MLKRENKKGVSEMVAYVMLIVIAVALSVIVYGYLQIYVPKETPDCSEDIFLIIKDAKCERAGDDITLSLILSNKGLFKVNAAYIRFAQEERKVRTWINPDNANKGLDENFYFNPINKEEGLNPGSDWPLTAGVPKTFTIASPLSTGVANPDKYVIEIQPAIIDEEFGLIACKAIITQPIECVPAA